MKKGNIIKSLRLLKGLSQKGVAKKLGISQQAYSKIESRSRISAQRIEAILKIININKCEISTLESFMLDQSNKS